MKKVRVYDSKVDVIVELSWENKLLQPSKELKLEIGDSLEIHYRNHSSDYTYENIPVYTSPYHPQEKLDFLLAKNPTLQKLIDRLDLVPSV